MEKFKATPPGREAKHPSLGLWGGPFSWGPDKQGCHEETNRWQKAPCDKEFRVGFFALGVTVIPLFLWSLRILQNAENRLDKPLLLIHKTDCWLGKVLARLRACTRVVKLILAPCCFCGRKWGRGEEAWLC